ncbi:MAG: hypothetical protein LRZ85_09390 [Alphaproteobacteria bacterium]|nr:hypothetical protein [Alphaproteobacteria bacterium]MCD8520427.1 hypothetical protein [Alphaproteobacteria bacterium]
MTITPLAGGAYRFYALIAALLFYAVLGTPTPESFGAVEIIIALLLVAATGYAGAVRPFGIGCPLPGDLTGGQMLLLYGLSFPLLSAALAGNGAGAIMRDMIPFLFFLLPLWMNDPAGSAPRQRPLCGIVIVMGLAFAARDCARLLAAWMDFSFLQTLAADPLSYLANAPTVLFAALMLTGMSGRMILKARRPRDVALAGFYLALALIPFTVMGLTLQRASIGMAALVVMFWVISTAITQPVRALRLILPLAFIALAFMPYLSGLAELMMEKTRNVGLNSRVEEIAAIWNAVSGNPLTLLFGLGWGAEFSSPAVGGLTVNFAHSMPAALLLKTGLCGVILSAFYMVAMLVGGAWRAFCKDPVITLALAAPIMIDTFLYAAYKSLDFGVILLLAYTTSRLAQGAGKDQ